MNDIKQKEAIFPPSMVMERPCSPVSFAVWFLTDGNVAVTWRTICLFSPHPVVLHKTTRVSGAGEEAEKKLAWMKAEHRLPQRTAFPRPGKTKQKVSVLFCFFFFLAFYPALVTVSFVAGGKQFLERALHSTRSPFLSQTAAEARPSYKCSFYAPLIQQPLKHWCWADTKPVNLKRAFQRINALPRSRTYHK